MKLINKENNLNTNGSAKELLDKISLDNYQNAAHPRFAKDIDPLYNKGYIKGFTWIDEMCEYYFRLEKNLVKEFKVHLQTKLDAIEGLPESEYKKGLKDSILKTLANL